MSIRIVTDSSADLPPEIAGQREITVVPCNVVVDDVTYKDGVDISADEFYQKLTTSARAPTTSQPSPADIQAVYQRLIDEGHQILSVHVSGKLSGTVNAAEQARNALEASLEASREASREASMGDSASIVVIDSQMASLSLGLLAISAAKLAREGLPLEELAQAVQSEVPLTHCVLALDTLEYLQKGGRIGKAQAFLGSVLSVKPILKVQDGEVHPVERPRNMDRAVRRLAELAREYAPIRQLGVIYSTEPGRADTLKEHLGDLISEDEVITSRFGSTLGTYVGPKAVGVALIGSR